MGKVSVTILLALLLGASATAQYAGFEYEAVLPDTVLPNGVQYLGGGLISDAFKNPVYGISQVSKGKSRMLWLEMSTGEDQNGVTGWRVLDVLTFSAPTASQYILTAHDPSVECRRRGRRIENLVASGTISRRQGTFTPQRAWIADTKNSRFLIFPVSGLRCTYSEP
jgi:hypothetical protein